MKLKVRGATIARIGALLVVLINECLALFGKAALPFTESMAYQVISLIVTIIVAGVNAWYNNDISQPALICGKIFDAMDDGQLTDDEIAEIIKNAEEAEANGYTNDAFLVSFANGVLKNAKEKIDNKVNKE